MDPMIGAWFCIFNNWVCCAYHVGVNIIDKLSYRDNFIYSILKGVWRDPGEEGGCMWLFYFIFIYLIGPIYSVLLTSPTNIYITVLDRVVYQIKVIILNSILINNLSKPL